jgi:hypothetical protein
MVSYKPIRLDSKDMPNTCYTDDGGDGSRINCTGEEGYDTLR